MANGRVGERKQRSDKKRDVKPTVETPLRECVYRIAFITNTPVKDVAEAIVIHSLTNRKVLEYVTHYFSRDMRIDDTLYRANPYAPAIIKRSDEKTHRITIRFKAEAYSVLRNMSYAMDCSVARACALLLEAGVKDGDFIDGFVRSYMERTIDAEQMQELRKLMRYVNANNPYDEEYTWAAVLSAMVDDVRGVAGAAKDFVVKHWKE